MNYKTLKLAAMDRYLDFWNMMYVITKYYTKLLLHMCRAYDYSGPQDSVAGHSSNLKRSTSDAKSTPFDTEQAVADYIAAGIPASKIVVGMPLYGRAFANTDGPGKPFTGVGNGTWELGVYDYKDLPLSGAVVNIDNATVAAWSYDPAKRHMVSFDTTYITRLKATFVKHHKLGGAMWWESSGDKKGANDSLISTVS
jgi:chitinase